MVGTGQRTRRTPEKTEGSPGGKDLNGAHGAVPNTRSIRRFVGGPRRRCAVDSHSNVARTRGSITTHGAKSALEEAERFRTALARWVPETSAEKLTQAQTGKGRRPILSSRIYVQSVVGQQETALFYFCWKLSLPSKWMLIVAVVPEVFSGSRQ